MSAQKTVLLGLSGGVDSAVAASLLCQAGYRVHGHFLDIGLGGEADARAVATRLGLGFSVGDVRAQLETLVCRPFREDYLAGRTPSPCARCNPSVKFPALLRAAEEIGADYIATGHYARIVREETGEYFLQRGQPDNDQVYMLARLPKALLSRILFPLGDLKKSEVRRLARQLSLHVAEKPDSMEICFIPDGDYAAWLERRGETPPPGDFITQDGTILGQHAGIHHYTLGQRRGLGIPAAHRLFVSELRPETNAVVLSNGDDLFRDRVSCGDLHLLAPLREGQSLELRIRHSKTAYPATLERCVDGTATLLLQTAARAPTAGQLAVLYDGDRVLASAWIL